MSLKEVIQTIHSNFVEQLQKASLKVTKHRISMLKFLTSEHGPHTIEEVHAKIGKDTCNLATVYRNLTAFEDKGLVQRCDFGDGVARYEHASPDSDHHHHHIICKKCQHVETIDACFFDDVSELVQNKGYKNISHHFEIFGICQMCQ